MTLSHTAASQQSASTLDQRDASDTVPSQFEKILPLLMVTAGFLVRLPPAWRYFLNPDEALHNLLASQSSVAQAYAAALTNAHPPLLIILLYYWRGLGQSEFILRLPSVIAGTASCWFIYRWLKLVTDRATALIGMLLFAFAPMLIWLSAELRQYALLLFFMTSCLYLSERAVQKKSLSSMILYSLSLYGALLTHYSSLIFAFTLGVYLLLRLHPYKQNPHLFLAWTIGQVGGVALAGYFLFTHVSRLKATGMIRGVAETYARKSLFHPSENNVLTFIALQTLRFFTYLFSHGVVGTLALIAFLAGTFLLVSGKLPWKNATVTPRQLALLLGLPFLTECGTALADIYPYGGIRHCILLAPFALAAASVAISHFWPTHFQTKFFVIAASLVVCNVFPAPPPMIRPRNQARALMTQAVDSLRQSIPPGSIILADHESGLLLGYYFCGHGIVQVFPPYAPFTKAECGSYTVITPPANTWKFYAADLQARVANAAAIYGLAPGTKIWLFSAGWINDSAPAIITEPRAGCSAPRRFGENVLVCELTVDRTPDSRRDRGATK